MASVLERLAPRMAGRLAWRRAGEDMVNLQRAGFLLDADRPTRETATRANRTQWSHIGRHIALLNDRRRTECFLAAVQAVVRHGDVVVDLGTGTGILAIAAARAGASRVYAIEESDIGAVAEANFRANGYGDRIQLIARSSADVELPAPADVLVSEIIGDDPLGESIIPCFKDARERLLKPGARVVPHRLRIFALPVCVPEDRLNEQRVTPSTLASWHSRYGIDLKATRERHAKSLLIRSKLLLGRAVGTPVLVYDAHLATARQLSIHVEGAFEATASRVCNGVSIYFELETAPGMALSTHPDRAGETNHWHQRVWLLREPFVLCAGSRYRLEYAWRVRHRADGAQVLR